MKVKDLDVFKANCEAGFCNRGTIYNSKTCKTDNKQDACYKKYVLKVERDNYKMKEKRYKKEEDTKDYIDKDLELKKIIWLRDSGREYNGSSQKNDWMNYCAIWQYILTEDEKKYILINHREDLWLNKTLDLLHIESRARESELAYDEKNVILSGRLWHSLLDNFKDIVKQVNISNEEREQWILRLKNYIGERY